MMSDRVVVKREDEEGRPLPSAPHPPKRLTSGKHKRNSSSAPKTRPAFVGKLWNMVNDPVNASHIQWTADGQSFEVFNREQFEKEVLPRYFKHSNFSSFVRQLNMYGWHKVQDVASGTMHTDEEIWQFKSPYFIRGREDLLDNIVRNKASKGSDDEDDSDLHRILKELESVKKNQQAIAADLLKLKQDNQVLWKDNRQHNERHRKHSETLERILRFLASLYGNQSRLLSDVFTQASIPKSQQRLLLHGTDSPADNDTGNGTQQTGEQQSAPVGRSSRISSISNGSSTIDDTPNAEGQGPIDNVTGKKMKLNLPPREAVNNNNNGVIQTPRQLFPELGYLSAAQQPDVTSTNMEPADPVMTTTTTTTTSLPTPGLTSDATPTPSSLTPSDTFSNNFKPEMGVPSPAPNYDQTSQKILSNDTKTDSLLRNLDLQETSLNQVENLLRKYDSSYVTNTIPPTTDPVDLTPINYNDFILEPVPDPSNPELTQIPDPQSIPEPLPKHRKINY
jgi:heat shock transcription factor